MKLIERDGKHVAAVVDDSGDPRLAPDAKTAADYMNAEQLVGTWKDEGKFAGAFAGTGASGAGSATSKTVARGGGPKRMITSEEIGRLDAEGIAAFNRGEIGISDDEVQYSPPQPHPGQTD